MMGASKVEQTGTGSSTGQVINGIKVDELASTVEAIKGAPELAKYRVRATNRWINGSRNRSVIKDFYVAGQEDQRRVTSFVVDADEPAVLLGEDQAPNPVEYLLHAMAACITTSLIHQAAAEGIKIDEVESEYEGDIDLRGTLGLAADIRNGFENIRVSFRIKADAPAEKIKELFRLAQQYSPVLDIVSNPVPVSVRMEVK